MENHVISFKMALSGIRYAVRTQPNFLVHTIAATLVILSGIAFRLSFAEWIAVTLAIVLVFSVEMVNTAIESMTDLITKDYHTEAKIAKDVSAGMVLVVAIGASLIGVLVFGPKIGSLLFR